MINIKLNEFMSPLKTSNDGFHWSETQSSEQPNNAVEKDSFGAHHEQQIIGDVTEISVTNDSIIGQ